MRQQVGLRVQHRPPEIHFQRVQAARALLPVAQAVQLMQLGLSASTAVHFWPVQRALCAAAGDARVKDFRSVRG